MKRAGVGLVVLLSLSGITQAQTAPAAPTPPKWNVTPYGLILANGGYVLGGVNNLDVPMWATLNFGQAQSDNNAFFFTARQTRAGIKGSWKTPANVFAIKEVAGIIELDFFGGMLGQQSYVFSIPRLRLAAASISWESIKLTMGQDWMVLAPLNPDSMLHMAIPGFSATGNIWSRAPQLRLEGTVGSKWKFMWAAAAILGFMSDAIPTADQAFTGGRKPEGGENSLAPAGQARVGIGGTLWGKPLGVGVSGHIGRRQIELFFPSTCATAAMGQPCPPFAFTAGAANGHVSTYTWAAALDLNIPLGTIAGFKGEVFYGSGLDAFFGGIQQGLLVARDGTGALTGVNTTVTSVGGWAQASVKPIKWMNLAAGFGMEAPQNLPAFDAAKKNDTRATNMGIYGSLAFDLVAGLSMGIEYDFLRTEMKSGQLLTSHVVALNAQLAF